MNFGLIPVLLLVVCVHQTTSSKIENVKPRWIYSNNKNSDSKSLPDSIQVDLELEGGKITLDLIRKLERSDNHPLILTKLEGQRSNWKGSQDELLGKYDDILLDASATVTIKKVDDVEEILYMITFNHGNKSFALGPSTLMDDDSEEVEAEDSKDNNMKNKLLNIDGILHTLYETHTATENDEMDEGYVKRIMKRSDEEPKKRLMTIEVFTAIDFSLFDKYYNISRSKTHEGRSEDSKKTIRYIFTHIFERIKDIYERIEHETLKFTVKWVGAAIAENVKDMPFMLGDDEILGTSGATDGLIKWVKNMKANKTSIKLPRYDLILAITKNYLKNKDNFPNGISRRNTVCKFPGNLGLIKFQKYFLVTSTMSHEMGHILGAGHDDSRNYCTDSAFVMKGFKQDGVPNFIKFSNCTINTFQERIEMLDKENKNCLVDGGEDFVPAREKDFYLRLYPGQLYDHDEQCKTSYGPTSYFVAGNNGGRKDLCEEIACNDGIDPKSSTFMPMAGTTCANGAWCRGGKCVPDSRAPKAPEQCIYGDYKFKLTSSSFNGSCKDHVHNPIVCQQFKAQCCLSCAENGTTSCEDTLDECPLLEPRDCYYEYYAKSCCKTCRSLVQNPDDALCLYGDRGTGCSKLVPEICHLSTRFCCGTCARYRSALNITT